jgi:uncharacterized coiled-coil protein SlyX
MMGYFIYEQKMDNNLNLIEEKIREQEAKIKDLTEMVVTANKDCDTLREINRELLKSLRISKEILDKNADTIKEMWGRLAIKDSLIKVLSKEDDDVSICIDVLHPKPLVITPDPDTLPVIVGEKLADAIRQIVYNKIYEMKEEGLI